MTRKNAPKHAQSPLETLWREFPELKNSTLVDRGSKAGDKTGDAVIRVFRLVNGVYLAIKSANGNKTVPIPFDAVDRYEEVWQKLGSRAIEHPSDQQPHGI